MPKRLPLVFLPLLYAPLCFANDAAWNCEQNKDTKEWLCLGDEKPATQSDSARSIPSSTPARVERDDEFSSPTPKTTYTPPPVKREEEPVFATKPLPSYKVEPEALPVAKPEPTVTPKPSDVAVQKPAAEETQTEDSESKKTKRVKAAASLLADDPVTPVKTNEEPVLTQTQEKVAANEEDAELDDSDDEEQEKAKKPSSAIQNTRMTGWNCASKTDDDWNCDLVGADPKGKAHPVRVAKADDSWHLLNPAFDTEQEQNFEALADRFNYDPWDEKLTKAERDKLTQTKKTERDTAPLELTSDFAEIFDNEISHYLGNVDIARADQHSLSHIANYDKVSEVLDLNGDVYYNEDQLALYGQSASLKLGTDEARLRNALFVSPATHLRGSSKVVYRDSKTFSRYKDVAYTSCRPGNQDWVLHADELKLNDVTGRGAVKDAWLEFKGLPVFYTPYLSFPKDDRRITGFLPTSLHYTQQGGFGIYAPFYWNIAPNYDFTFTPRYLTSRGILLGGNFRYLDTMTRGYTKFEYLPNDYQMNRPRYLAGIRNSTVFMPNLTANLDLNYVSDKNYFNQLGNALSIPNYGYLKSFADVNYNLEGMALSVKADNYQRIGQNLVGLPYRRVPQVNLDLNHSFQSFPLTLSLENEGIEFQQNNQASNNAFRFNTKPTVSVPFQSAAGFINPKASFQYTQYAISDGLATAGDTSISRTLPILSLDSGAFFEKEFSLSDTPMTHTIEPRLFYLYVPYQNQNNIPLLDTATYDFVFDSLFRENQFSGRDRWQNANQVSAAITTRLVDSKGKERLKLNVGDIFYFQDRKVGVRETASTSPIVTELNAALTDHVSVETGMQWDPHLNDITRGKVAFHYTNQPDGIFNAGYYYRRNPLIPDRLDDIAQTDVSFHWPIYDGWSAVGRWQYSLLYDRTQEGFFGLEKENCCWRFRLMGRRYINGMPVNSTFTGANVAVNQALLEGTAQTSVFFQVELKGLMGFGEQLGQFFERNIYGYRKPKE